MSLVIKGKLQVKGDTQVVSEKFKKREFVLELEEEINGNIYTNYAKMQLVQNKCDIIDRFNPGDHIIVDFNIKGNRWEKDGKVNYITNLDAWRIAADQQYQNGPAQNQGIPVHSASHTTNGGSGYAAQTAETLDDLPF